jgi:hypothetical protein
MHTVLSMRVVGVAVVVAVAVGWMKKICLMINLGWTCMYGDRFCDLAVSGHCCSSIKP